MENMLNIIVYNEMVSVDPTNVWVQFNYESGTTSSIWTTLYYFIQMVSIIYFEKNSFFVVYKLTALAVLAVFSVWADLNKKIILQ